MFEAKINAEKIEPITYPNSPKIKFYEPKSRRANERLDQDLHAMDRRMVEYRRARGTLSEASRSLITEIVTMCNVDRVISYKYHIQSIYNAIRVLPSPYCDIVEPKVKPVDFRGTLFEDKL